MKRFLFLIVPVLVLVSCNLFSISDSIVVELPSQELPWAVETLPESWNIVWLGEGGREQQRTLESTSSRRLRLDLPRERAVVVLAEPVGTAPLPFTCSPAGAVLGPGDIRPQLLNLRWEDGFAAKRLIAVARKGIPVEALNLSRFTECCLKRSEGNPWNLDERLLIEKLLSGELWVYSFKLREEVDTVLEFPVSGHWFTEYPLASPLEVVSGLWCGSLCTGIHRFTLGAEGPVAETSIDNRGRATTIIIE